MSSEMKTKQEGRLRKNVVNYDVRTSCVVVRNTELTTMNHEIKEA
jgi:hypothetical protein